jgi:hypothetical protein
MKVRFEFEFLLTALLIVFLAGPPLWWAGEALRDARAVAVSQGHSYARLDHSMDTN